MRSTLSPLAFILSSCFAFAQTANTWYVPDDYATIQGGIDAIQIGDTLIVRDGTYFENIHFNGNEIILKSEHGAESTVINGSQQGSVVSFENNLGWGTTRLEGFTITNGSGTFDVNANILCGGGIYMKASAPLIQECIIKNNQSGFGGGVYMRDDSAAILSSNTISNNSARAGGGLCIIESETRILNNLILNNSAYAGNGGAMTINDSFSTVIQGNIIAFNTASGSGGGIASIRSLLWISKNSIAFNTAQLGGGIHLSDGSMGVLFDSILWVNVASQGDNLWIGGGFWGTSASMLEISFCALSDGWSSTYLDPYIGNTLFDVAGNIDDDPMFLNPLAGQDYSWNNFELQSGSPCIDSGHPTSQADADGSPSDMGAVYYDHNTIRPTLSVSSLIAGQTAVVQLSNCTPNRTVFLAWSMTSRGPINTPYGKAYVGAPYQVKALGSDSSGGAIIYQDVPSQLSGQSIWFHGLDIGSGTLLNPVAVTIL